ncbi:MAG: TIGR01777 family protein [Actinobacteria bacterium 69-20]|nr:TIGR01777 family oxidoreductase [Actinomycetota bacterium]OJV23134.1 MAG: TIGR01777 family protein [Actinobacteria bacterium 69-20]
MRVVIAGGSGFLGRHLTQALRQSGDRVTALVRRAPRGPDEAGWDPVAGVVPFAAIDGADTVVNFCGAGIGDRRWTDARREVLRASRIEPTELLAAACAKLSVPTLVNASAVGYYGDRGDDTVTEADGPGAGFLARLCADWEAATGAATAAGVRVVNLRTGLVLGPDGGMLPRLVLLTKALLGGRLGSGQQWWPWISIVDHIAAVRFLLRGSDSRAVHGPVNLTAPMPVTNAEFTRALGAVLRRPTPWAIPPLALRAALGDFAGEILTGQRALPSMLESSGFTFLQPELATALRSFALATRL